MGMKTKEFIDEHLVFGGVWRFFVEEQPGQFAFNGRLLDELVEKLNTINGHKHQIKNGVKISMGIIFIGEILKTLRWIVSFMNITKTQDLRKKDEIVLMVKCAIEARDTLLAARRADNTVKHQKNREAMALRQREYFAAQALGRPNDRA